MTDEKNIPMPPVTRPEKRFPRAAADFVNTLLDAERLRFEQELQATGNILPQESPWPAPPKNALLTAEGDGFFGSGWSALDRGRGGINRRWMAQVGSILLSADCREGGHLQLKGGGFLKRHFVDGLTVWVDDWPVSGSVKRRGFSGWSFDGTVGSLPQRPYHILKLHVPGSRAYEAGPNGRGSIALSAVQFDAP